MGIKGECEGFRVINLELFFGALVYLKSEYYITIKLKFLTKAHINYIWVLFDPQTTISANIGSHLIH
jgi:hypothetical protein